MEHSEFYQFATRFWWLIFPIFWGLAGLTRALLRHGRVNRTLDIVKSYADQGKDVPPEVLAALQDRGHWHHGYGHHHHHRGQEKGWSHFFFFAALAVAFTTMAVLRGEDGDHRTAFIFVAIIMVGLALSGLVKALTHRNDTLPPPDGPIR